MVDEIMNIRKVTILLLVTALSNLSLADKGPYDWAYVHLGGVRDEKVQLLRDFCERIHTQAINASTDTGMLEFFDINQRFYQTLDKQRPTAEVAKKISLLHSAFEDRYIRNWMSFYDILFIDLNGSIFYSIRKESVYGKNLFETQLCDTPLSGCLQKKPEKEVFIDFHYYGVSQEPASFFVEPVYKNGKHSGWIVLQLAINKINSLFAGTETLGSTNEAIVVNRQGYMLTESNFVSEESILKTKLDDCNIEPKFQEKRGNRVVTDYRGFKVLTSFEVVDFLGVQWLVVVKMDESQVTTEHYIQHQAHYEKRITDYLNNSYNCMTNCEYTGLDNKVIRQVDMDEFVRAKHDELLQTLGVSTCTAVIATYPGKFGYMAHVSPLDSVYGGNVTDLVGLIVKKIKTYDIYKYERRYVQFVIVARHLNSLQAIVDKLVHEGFLLSQISIMYNPQAEYARVAYDYSQDHLNVVWMINRRIDEKSVQDKDCAKNIGDIVKGYISRQDRKYANESPLKSSM